MKRIEVVAAIIHDADGRISLLSVDWLPADRIVVETIKL